MSNDETTPDDAPRRLRLSWGGATHQGQIRPINQDALFADRGLFVVADGMGGHQAGEVASRITVKTLAGRDHTSLDDLVDSVDAANAAVFEHASSGEEFKGMGTTLTAMAVVGDGRPPQLGLVNVGDSRVYRFRENGLEQLTDDHSYVAELVRRGQITEDQAETHPYRNMLTRAIGVADAVEPDKWVLDPVADDVYLLCSDGLTNEVTEEEIADVLRDEHDPTAAARALIDRANRSGGRDNITVVIVNVELELVDPTPQALEPDDVSPMETGVIASVTSTAPDTAELEDLATGVNALIDGEELVEEEPVEEGRGEGTSFDDGSVDGGSGDHDGDGEGDAVDVAVDEPADTTADVAASTAVISPDIVAAALAPTVDEPDTGEAGPVDVETAEPEPTPPVSDPLGALADDEEELRPPSHPGDALAAFDLPQLDGDDASLPWLADPDPPGGDEVVADGRADAVVGSDDPDDTDPGTIEPVEGSDVEGSEVEDSDDDATVIAPVVAATTDSDDASEPDAAEPGASEPGAPEPGPDTSESDTTQPIMPQPVTPFRDPITASGPVDHFAPAVRGWKAPVAVTWRSLLFVTVVIAVIVAAGGLVAWYARGAYYVGYAGDEVVIYQGRPGGVLWFDPTLEESTGIFRQELSESIAAEVEMLFETSTLDDARIFVEEIRPDPGVLSLDDDPPTASP